MTDAFPSFVVIGRPLETCGLADAVIVLLDGETIPLRGFMARPNMTIIGSLFASLSLGVEVYADINSFWRQMPIRLH